MLKQNEIAPNEKERIDASVASETSKVYAANKLSKFFEIELTIRVFGKVIYHYVFPPKN